MKKTIAHIQVEKKTKNGGQITINTGAVDRDRDRVLPSGARIENYLKNPVVQWGHNYIDPWATIGKTTSLEVSKDTIKATFEFREPVSDADPVKVVKTLWDGGFINTASIGFNPNMEMAELNDNGGFDFHDWELLEWSLVPVPSNQEALRNAVKAFDNSILIQIDDDTSVAGTQAPIEEAPIKEEELPPPEPEKEQLETESTIENEPPDEWTDEEYQAIQAFIEAMRDRLGVNNE